MADPAPNAAGASALFIAVITGTAAGDVIANHGGGAGAAAIAVALAITARAALNAHHHRKKTQSQEEPTASTIKQSVMTQA